MSFLLGENAREEAKRSIKGLMGHAKTKSEREPLFLVVNTRAPLIRQNDHTPRIIPITHKLHKADEKTVLLITKDPSLYYRAELTKKNTPTEDLFHHIMLFTKAKLAGHSAKALLRLFKENDIVLADTRVHKRLPEVLGSQFYGKNKKVPFLVQMAKPGPRQTHGKTETLCDPKYVYSQVKAIVQNTYFIPPAGGTCMNIVVGYSDWKVSEVLANIDDVMSYLIEEKHRPVGGLLNRGNLHSVLLKTSNSVALPVLKATKKEDDEEEDSDLDF